MLVTVCWPMPRMKAQGLGTAVMAMNMAHWTDGRQDWRRRERAIRRAGRAVETQEHLPQALLTRHGVTLKKPMK